MLMSWPGCPAFADPALCPPAFLLWDPTKVPPRLQAVTDDHIRMHKVLQDSGLKYVAVMPPHIGEWGRDQQRCGHRPAPPVLWGHLPGLAWLTSNSKPSRPHFLSSFLLDFILLSNVFQLCLLDKPFSFILTRCPEAPGAGCLGGG